MSAEPERVVRTAAATNAASGPCRDDLMVRLAVLPAQLLSLVAALPLMAAPFILAWTALIRFANGAWPPASVAEVTRWAKVWTPPGAGQVPIWLALAVVGWLGLLASNLLAKVGLRLLDALATGGRPVSGPR